MHQPPPPLKPRSPPKVRRGASEPLLSRSFSHAALNRPQQQPASSESLVEGLHRCRPMRNTLLLLLSLVLAANCLWVAQGVAAWRQGKGLRLGGGEGQHLFLQRLNSTTLSVEVSRLGSQDGEAAERSTYLLNAHVVDSPNGTSSSSGGDDGAAAANTSAAASSSASASGGGDRRRAVGGGSQQVTAQAVAAAGAASDQQQEESSGDFVSQLKGVGSVLSGALVAAKDSVVDGIAGGGGSTQKEAAAGQGQGQGGNSTSRAAVQAPAAHGKSVNGSEAKAAHSPAPPPPPHRAVLRMPEVFDRSPDQCAQALGTKKVALLFLTRGDLFHHDTWRRWFEAARGQLPAAALRTAACGSAAAPAAAPAAEPKRTASGRRQLPELLIDSGEAGEDKQQDWQAEGPPLADPAGLAAACGWDLAAGQPLPPPMPANASSNSSSSGGASQELRHLIEQQHLFNVYVHAPPSVTDADLPEMFRGRLVTDRLLPEWGTHQLVEATRNLLWEAYRDPLSEQFVLLSESDIPLYDPLTLWAQLMAEDKSRINSCKHVGPTDTRRWSWRMSTPTLKAWHWRKSSQWFGMLRRHVDVVLQDTEVFRKFEEHCKNAFDGDYKRWRDCFSDEHYLPSLLAAKGLANESSCCIDGIVSVDWSAGGPHPKSYKSWEVRPSLVHAMRGQAKGCKSEEAIADAQRLFVSKEAAFGSNSSANSSQPGSQAADPALWQQRLCSSTLAGLLPAYEHPLALNCPLTARKFTKPTVRAVARLFNDCRHGLNLLGPQTCRRRLP